MIAALFAATLALAATPAPDIAFGAASITANPNINWGTVDTVDYITPAPEAAHNDVADPEREGCIPRANGDLRACVDGAPNAEHHVMLVGDSKALQWHPAIAPIAAELGWRLTSAAYSGCPIVDAELTLSNGEPYVGCEAWTDKVIDLILTESPDVLIVSGGRAKAYPTGGNPADSTFGTLVDGYARLWQRLTDAGIKVVVVINNGGPPADHEMWQCAAEHRDDLSACTFPYSTNVADYQGAAGAQYSAADLVPDVGVVDLNEWVCPNLQCPAVIGNVLVYRQLSHLTGTYVATMQPMMSEALSEATDGVFGVAG